MGELNQQEMLAIIQNEIRALQQIIYANELRAQILVRVGLKDDAKPFIEMVEKNTLILNGYLDEKTALTSKGAKAE